MGKPLSHQDHWMVLGSCFTEHVGSKLKQAGFRVCLNPFGILYNPMSILTALQRLDHPESFRFGDLVQRDGLFHSFMHHGRFSSTDREETLDQINQSLMDAALAWSKTSCLMLTLGTAWVYTLPDSGQIVANCHRFPESVFLRQRLSVEHIIDAYERYFDALFVQKPDLKVVLTVSPIRHIRDGMEENTRSKAILHLAIESLCARYKQVAYFPSYELIMDDLRDYRFYAEDLLHPSEMAQTYVWEQFSDAFFSKSTHEVIKQVLQIRKAMEHKPFRPDDETYLRFAQKQVATLAVLKARYPELDLDAESQFFEQIVTRFV